MDNNKKKNNLIHFFFLTFYNSNSGDDLCEGEKNLGKPSIDNEKRRRRMTNIFDGY